MKKQFVLIGSILLVVLVLFVIVTIRNEGMKQDALPIISELTMSPEQTSEEYKASFLIFTHGTKRTFDAAMYRNQSNEVYIGEGNASILIVQSREVTWNDFFKTLPFSLTQECLITGTGETYCSGNGGKLRFFINNREDPAILEKQIQPQDKLLITFGTETGNQIVEQFNQIPSAE